MTEELSKNKEELERVINEMTGRIEKVAEMVDLIEPGVGEGIKQLAKDLRGHVTDLTNVVQDELDFTFDALPTVKSTMTPAELGALAVKDCAETFKFLAKARAEYVTGNILDTQAEAQLKIIDMYGRHARELFASLANYSWS